MIAKRRRHPGKPISRNPAIGIGERQITALRDSYSRVTRLRGSDIFIRFDDLNRETSSDFHGVVGRCVIDNDNLVNS